jgi:hypothetical protein
LEFGQFPCLKACDGPSHMRVCIITSDLSGPIGPSLTDLPVSMAPRSLCSDDPSDYNFSHNAIAAHKRLICLNPA